MKVRVNGVTRSVAVDWQNETLLSVLREFLNLPGSRYSCGIGQCGACTVHIEGQPVASCVTPVSAAQNKDVLTIEGLASADGELHPLQQAWIEESVPQCGYCQSGQIMQALALLNEQPDPSEVEIVRSMSGNLCRCGTYDRIKKAIRSAAQTMREAT